MSTRGGAVIGVETQNFLEYLDPIKKTSPVVTRFNDPALGKISRYAWGDDYHLVLAERLEKLLEFIKTEIPGVAGKIYVDTGPLMEKAWAARARKHSMDACGKTERPLRISLR